MLSADWDRLLYTASTTMSHPYQSSIDQLKYSLAEATQALADPELAELAKAEIEQINTQLCELEQLARNYENQSDPSSSATEGSASLSGACIMELRGGAGGDEAKLWAGELERMYLRFAETTKLKFSFIDELVVKFSGSIRLGTQKLSAYDLLKYESGVHRVQRVPVTEAQGRIHTSTASVAVLPEIPPSAVTIKDEDLDWQFMRAGGAGGQNVNKVNSAVRLTHIPSGIVVTARSEKQQQQNRSIALDLLRSQLWEIEEEARLKQEGEVRSIIGRAKRSEKIRTYNFPQNRVTDHRTKQSWYDLENIIEGNLDVMLTELHAALEKNPDAGDQTPADSESEVE